MRTRLASLVYNLHALYQSEDFLYLDPSLQAVHDALQAGMGGLRYDDAQNEFVGDAPPEVVRHIVRTFYPYMMSHRADAKKTD